MDPRLSPYSPGAGNPPIVFAGREEVVEKFDVILDRLESGRSASGPVITGPRGSGKTVILNLLLDRARSRGWAVGAEEAIPETPLATLIALLAREALNEMSSRHRTTERIKRALGVLKAFTSVSVAGVSLNINADAITGTADTGILAPDLRRLFIELGELAAEHSVGVAFALDEVHIVDQEELGILHSALHATAQRGLPVAFLGAGLFPSWKKSAFSVMETPFISSFDARVGTFAYMRLKPLTNSSACDLLQESAASEGVRYADIALNKAVEFCEGNPWLLQSVGSLAWEAARSSPIDFDAVLAATGEMESRLREWFFPRLLRKCSKEELRILAVVARRDGNSPAHIVQSRLDFDVTPALLDLARKDIITISGHGTSIDGHSVKLSVPRLLQYLRSTNG